MYWALKNSNERTLEKLFLAKIRRSTWGIWQSSAHSMGSVVIGNEIPPPYSWRTRTTARGFNLRRRPYLKNALDFNHIKPPLVFDRIEPGGLFILKVDTSFKYVVLILFAHEFFNKRCRERALNTVFAIVHGFRPTQTVGVRQRDRLT